MCVCVSVCVFICFVFVGNATQDVDVSYPTPPPQPILYSCSTLTVDFNWEYSNGFEIRPKSGSLAPKGDIYFSATFSPQRACVYDMAAVCSYGNENPTTKSMNLEGVGKYPHVLVRLAPPPTLAVLKGRGGEGEEGAVAQSELTVNFGCVPVGAVSERLVEIVNMSPVSVCVCVCV